VSELVILQFSAYRVVLLLQAFIIIIIISLIIMTEYY